MDTNNFPTDLQSLICEGFSSEYASLEQEQELMLADATDDGEWQGYSEWAADLEEAAWQGAEMFDGVTIKKACEHRDCSHFRCEKNLRLGGVEI